MSIRYAQYRALAAGLVFAAFAASVHGEGIVYEPVKQEPEVALSPEQIQKRIRTHRTTEATLTIVGEGGKPLANAEVTFAQTRHKFLFGANFFGLKPGDESPEQRTYRKRFTELLNFATLPFYWRRYEPEPGETRFEKLQAMARWCRERGITTKGHPLAWHTAAPTWQDEKSLEEMWTLQKARVKREVEAFKGLIDMWDVINETVILPKFTYQENHLSPLAKKRGRQPIIEAVFELADKVNPDATLLINDFDHSKRYEQVIETALENDVPIDVIGLQSHMHKGYSGDANLWNSCERFARFGKPIHWTEASLISGEFKPDMNFHDRHENWTSTPAGEKRQTEKVERFYTLLFSHPSVEAITWWDLPDGRWLGAPSGLIREDMSPKPAYERLMKLIKGEWWTSEQTANTDANGRVTFRGFLGDYRLDAGEARATFRLATPGTQSVTVTLGP